MEGPWILRRKNLRTCHDSAGRIVFLHTKYPLFRVRVFGRCWTRFGEVESRARPCAPSHSCASFRERQSASELEHVTRKILIVPDSMQKALSQIGHCNQNRRPIQARTAAWPCRAHADSSPPKVAYRSGQPEDAGQIASIILAQKCAPQDRSQDHLCHAYRRSTSSCVMQNESTGTPP